MSITQHLLTHLKAVLLTIFYILSDNIGPPSSEVGAHEPVLNALTPKSGSPLAANGRWIFPTPGYTTVTIYFYMI